MLTHDDNVLKYKKRASFYTYGENGGDARGKKPRKAARVQPGLRVGIIWRMQLTHGTTISRRPPEGGASDHALDAGAQRGFVEQCLGAVPNAVS